MTVPQEAILLLGILVVVMGAAIYFFEIPEGKEQKEDKCCGQNCCKHNEKEFTDYTKRNNYTGC